MLLSYTFKEGIKSAKQLSLKVLSWLREGRTHLRINRSFYVVILAWHNQKADSDIRIARLNVHLFAVGT